jgi:hypothetical protein
VLCVPWRTLAGWSSEPGELSRIGPVTAGVARDLALAAAADATCQWRVIVVGRSGRAFAVTKIRRVGAGTRGDRGGTPPGVVGRITLTVPASLLNPIAMPAIQDLAGREGLVQVLWRALRAAADAFSARRSRVGPGSCAHEEASPGYRVPDPMRALVEARDLPVHLSAECSRHHHLKHLPSWRLDQPRPGILTWTTPARLTHTVTSGPYPF